MRLQEVTVGPKYQVVIPKSVREIVSGIKKGHKVMVCPLNQYAVKIEALPAEKKWLVENYGFAATAWMDIDATTYIRQLREEWEQRLKNLPGE